MTAETRGEIKIATSDGMIRVILNRPPLNILNVEFMRKIEKILRESATISDARVLAILAEGRAFCAGVDVADHTPERTAEMLQVFHGLVRLLWEFPIPTVAIVQGAAFGGGFELALACDLILASDRAKFAVPEITLGVFPPVAMVHLPRVIGCKKASELIYTGATLSAADAECCGLINAVYPEAKLDEGVAEFLVKFTKMSRTSLIETKKAYRQAALYQDPNDALKVAEDRYLGQLMATCDAKEGIAAFMEKREPAWSHR